MSAEVLEAPVAKSKKIEVPTMFIEVLVKGDSGYVRDDTAGSPHEERITCAEMTFVPNTGYMAEPILDGNSKETGRYSNVEIRYIKNCPYIKVKEQKDYGWEPSKLSNNDAIVIRKGRALLKREGDTGLYDYIEKVYYNKSAPNRTPSSKAIFKVVEVDKNIARVNEGKFLQAKAISTVETMVLRVGDGYRFKEDKIDNLLTALNLFGGENYGDKIRVLAAYAETQPKTFLDTFSKMDNVTITEITHALELGVIKLDGQNAVYTEGGKVVGVLDKELTHQKQKIEALAELIKSPTNTQAYVELRAKVEMAKEKQFKA